MQELVQLDRAIRELIGGEVDIGEMKHTAAFGGQPLHPVFGSAWLAVQERVAKAHQLTIPEGELDSLGPQAVIRNDRGDSLESCPDLARRSSSNSCKKTGLKAFSAPNDIPFENGKDIGGTAHGGCVIIVQGNSESRVRHGLSWHQRG